MIYDIELKLVVSSERIRIHRADQTRKTRLRSDGGWMSDGQKEAHFLASNYRTNIFLAMRKGTHRCGKKSANCKKVADIRRKWVDSGSERKKEKYHVSHFMSKRVNAVKWKDSFLPLHANCKSFAYEVKPAAFTHTCVPNFNRIQAFPCLPPNRFAHWPLKRPA